MAVTQSHFKSTSGTENYVPFEMNIIEGDGATYVHMLRDVSNGDGQLLAGMWRADPVTIDYVFGGDETLHVLRGEADVELDTGEVVHLSPGDIASFVKGQHSIWRIASSFEKFFVISG